MNLYFNDLTLSDDPGRNKQLLRDFARMFRDFSRATGEQRAWVPEEVKRKLKEIPWTAGDLTLWYWANAALNLKGQGAPVESMDVEERFLSSSFEIDVDGALVRCDQMGLAALTKPSGTQYSLTVGFPLNAFWRALRFNVLEMQASTRRKDHSSLCVVYPEQIDEKSVREWCQLAYEIRLPECPLAPEEKTIHLRDDHGKDVLMTLAKRLVSSPYVVKIVNSLPFKPDARSFVDAVSPDGLIELRLHNDPRGIGLVVQTSGMTLDQTERIARVLERKFAKN